MEWQWERIGRPFGLSSPFAFRLSIHSTHRAAAAARPRAHTRTTHLSAFVHINSTTQQHDQRTLVQAASAAERIAASARPLDSAALLRSPRRPTRRRGLQTVLQLTRSATAD